MMGWWGLQSCVRLVKWASRDPARDQQFAHLSRNPRSPTSEPVRRRPISKLWGMVYGCFSQRNRARMSCGESLPCPVERIFYTAQNRHSQGPTASSSKNKYTTRNHVWHQHMARPTFTKISTHFRSIQKRRGTSHKCGPTPKRICGPPAPELATSTLSTTHMWRMRPANPLQTRLHASSQPSPG